MMIEHIQISESRSKLQSQMTILNWATLRKSDRAESKALTRTLFEFAHSRSELQLHEFQFLRVSQLKSIIVTAGAASSSWNISTLLSGEANEGIHRAH